MEYERSANLNVVPLTLYSDALLLVSLAFSQSAQLLAHLYLYLCRLHSLGALPTPVMTRTNTFSTNQMSSRSEVIILGFWQHLKPSYCFRPGLIKTGCANAHGWGRHMFRPPTHGQRIPLCPLSFCRSSRGQFWFKMNVFRCSGWHVSFLKRSPSSLQSLTLAWLKQSNRAVFVADILITIYNILRGENRFIGWQKRLPCFKLTCWRSLQFCNTGNNNNNNNAIMKMYTVWICTMHTNRAGTIKTNPAHLKWYGGAFTPLTHHLSIDFGWTCVNSAKQVMMCIALSSERVVFMA
jgi:hypothetical protein